MLRSLLILLPAVSVLGGCASAPPDLGFLDQADEQALEAAAGGAVEHAPLELRYAREKLAEARTAADAREFDQARRLAQQSQVNSELASAKTVAAKAREAARQSRESNEALIRELGPADGGSR